jgi:dTMP kinase
MFIVFEGGEGCGKTTLRKAVSDRLRSIGRQVIETREPGGSPMAEEIRSVLLANRDEEVEPLTEALLFFAGRNQHVERIILPALKEGKIVLCDRFIDSSYALQCCGGELSKNHYESLVEMTLGGFRPDLTVVLDHDPAVTFVNVLEREFVDRMELKGLDYHKKVRKGFIEQAEQNPAKYLVLQAHRDITVMVEEVLLRMGI